MISTGQIVAAGVITGVAVAIATAWLRWPRQWLLTAAVGSAVLIIAWRALSNLLHLNGDFVPAVSIGDVGCLVVGAIAAALTAALLNVPNRLRWIPAVVGGSVGFVVNVLIL